MCQKRKKQGKEKENEVVYWDSHNVVHWNGCKNML